MACTPAEQPGQAPTADLIVEGSYVVTMDESQSVIKDGAVAIKDGLIIALASAADINSQYTAAEHVKGDNRIVMPSKCRQGIMMRGRHIDGLLYYLFIFQPVIAGRLQSVRPPEALRA